jgi:hypothetical protein
MKAETKQEQKHLEGYWLYKPHKHKGQFKTKIKRLASKARRRHARKEIGAG